ncbi:PQQ-binding-like beta-propeller repeat protein [Gordonia sp. (in: high G+C Gram-positive bacteria)]|jgi:outer membrane protein assembly factor BamB|uniref:outer membrane protein assembly factor BamB family protein n=1 Tax=Gordonia sp. (in: high G+C Gram-positive bacteria) TaxID=84139 RepID=UPI001D32F9F4|nr:PQQ-binding-like beta-propeller repeat protein [Gordonia sp. (in: high G+C Gram-positive bacteria)]MCB1297174.1 PQQ-binding-like beta-propeller repeat protein [Gordonia sp. (in: high G+C Gram-positive bacteria)]HQV18484.1 PQQ-binding-like beta-propeller repeat protein [Gordonia sp. (in: high G+C Gram-positive bacteria)]
MAARAGASAATGDTERRRRIGTGFALLTAALTLVVSACSDGHTDVRSVSAWGWSSFGGNSFNSNFAGPQISDDLELRWSRPTGGPVTAPLSISGNGNIGVTATTTNGCNMFVFDPRQGRKNYCKRLQDGAATNTLLVDQYDQPYIGEKGLFIAFNAGGAIRWRVPTIGVPRSARFADRGVVLVATTQGQVLLLNSQTGDLVAPELRLREDVNLDDPGFGYGDCITDGPQCPVPSPPAVDAGRQRAYLNFWPAGESASKLIALDYRMQDRERSIHQVWSAAIPGGMIGPPTLSADGSRVYAVSKPGTLLAVDTTTGKTVWTHNLGEHGFATLAVSPGGLIIPTGSVGAPLTLLRDTGSAAEQVWQRTDLAVVSLSTLTARNTAWTVVRDAGKDSLSLTEVSTADGKTLRTIAMPGSKGFATGVAVSAAGQVATATHIGEVYLFDSASNRY